MHTLLDAYRSLTWLLLFAQATCLAQIESSVDVLAEGYWLEVRGSYQADGTFLAKSVDLVQPGRYETLIGTISSVQEDGYFTLMGQRVKARGKVTFDGVNRNALEGVRVKVRGHYRNEEEFSARKISARHEGRGRVTGRIDSIRNKRKGLEVTIMAYRVLIPEDLPVRHELALGLYQSSEAGALAIVDRDRVEEDRFGEGVRFTDKLLLTGKLKARITTEDEFDLNDRDPEDRNDLKLTFQARLIYQPRSSFFAVAGLTHRRRLRDDDKDGRLEDGTTTLGETYLYLIDPFGNGLDLQAGRAFFREQRDWIYSRGLDTLRAIWTGKNMRAELSYSETLSNGSREDEAAANSMLYISNDDDRHLAGYIIHRKFDLAVPVRRTHYGLRALGEWLPEQESWLEIAHMEAKTGQIASRGWALDIGTTWRLHDHFALTLGYAIGQGDDPESDTDNTFRQTGLQRNNAKFAGVTSFSYYGELVDPELANMEILTAGLGWLPRKGISLSLVGHTYRQNELSRRLINTDIDKRPNGIDADLGWEIDLVLGWKTNRHWSMEVVAAWFNPGDAFNEEDNVSNEIDNAFFGKVQYRYRF